MEELEKQKMEDFEKKFIEQLDKISIIRKEGTNFRSLLSNSNDWHDNIDMFTLIAFNRDIAHITSLVVSFSYLKDLAYRMNDEKDRFEIQRLIKKLTESYQETLDSVIETGRLWKFYDYRCIDWEKRLVSLMIELKSFFVADL